ncbi:MAG: hypothetical protein JST16_07155 [Bdellovibrionales bacterium]|nr:hypothetical protein [Bdellovibrionales bacterium]
MNDSSFRLVGADVFIRHTGLPVALAKVEVSGFELKIMSNRGTKVWPGTLPNIHLTDVFRCRFMAKSQPIDVLSLLGKIEKAGFEWVHVEKLHELNGKPGFSLAQGE